MGSPKKEIHKGLRNFRQNIFHKRFTDEWMEKDRRSDNILQSVFNPILPKLVKIGKSYGAHIPNIKAVETTLPSIRF